MHVLVLGGTTEARRLAESLAEALPAGARVTSSLMRPGGQSEAAAR